MNLMNPMNAPLRDWHKQRVWVIGASSGIGAETARKLLAKGARVALSARNATGLNEIAAGQHNALTVVLDITQHDTVLAARDQILNAWHGIDLILIVAGGYGEMRVDSFDLTLANRLIDLNLRGVMHCLDATLPVLLKQGQGAIGIVASVAGYSGLPRAMAYGATKAALINLSECLYFDLHPRGIGVYLINPGFVDTPLTADNDFPMPAMMSASSAAEALIEGVERGHFHIHFPKRFTNWLRFARLLPYRAYFALIHKVTGL
ncbi:SDR family NAD(P)-dependent oxidoreductase [Glaciimonas sp. CA11.2]|uniref:SDR family NAD(P)-dependent oxidoreductase n=1 Tax=Glaciimonas sp. CA11.2 TaxID=3048601 RepID=UPI002AB58552|nr:SDR family NAD(P)-dependent oxidoreductase [Glaciimonas sp. CA11.2]MDY7546424.1 SDR family NAD(P)-dependent oxidoreductase [Glaciimonas sp. CA11.2]MEB0162557.1 SDR family NAD(P)-dependent oxidoreductase [Glaciimonas sp. CA11.2]